MVFFHTERKKKVEKDKILDFQSENSAIWSKRKELEDNVITSKEKCAGGY